MPILEMRGFLFDHEEVTQYLIFRPPIFKGNLYQLSFLHAAYAKEERRIQMQKFQFRHKPHTGRRYVFEHPHESPSIGNIFLLSLIHFHLLSIFTFSFKFE